MRNNKHGKVTVNIKRHSNGYLQHFETVLVLNKDTAHLFEYRTKHPDGFDWIRLGKAVKYHDNGQLAWVLNYDDKGCVVRENNKSYRKDGSVIQY